MKDEEKKIKRGLLREKCILNQAACTCIILYEGENSTTKLKYTYTEDASDRSQDNQNKR